MPERTIVGYIRVREVVEPAPEGGFVSLCPELGVASQGETIDDALTSLQEAIETFLDTLAELGDRETYLNERGVKVFLAEPLEETSISVKPGEVVSTFVAAIGHGLIPA